MIPKWQVGQKVMTYISQCSGHWHTVLYIMKDREAEEKRSSGGHGYDYVHGDGHAHVLCGSL